MIHRAVAGDQRALEAVIRLWGPRVRRFARRLCPATEVLDAVQETLLVLADQIGTLRAAEALSSWTFQVVRHHCQKVFSHLRRDTALARQLGVEEASPPDADKALLLDQLAQALLRLPVRDREILTLRDLEGLSSRQTADRLGLGESAVKSRLHRARMGLRKEMTASDDRHR